MAKKDKCYTADYCNEMVKEGEGLANELGELTKFMEDMYDFMAKTGTTRLIVNDMYEIDIVTPEGTYLYEEDYEAREKYVQQVLAQLNEQEAQ